MNYAYKMLAAVAMIPLIYVTRSMMLRYLGRDRAAAMQARAAA